MPRQRTVKNQFWDTQVPKHLFSFKYEINTPNIQRILLSNLGEKDSDTLDS